ncbi:MAG TPA: DegT/DnrJ/EryC1/StrS family aminotransferase [Nitrospira sp.]|nr:DegT/DnrJ/EryC1/StrS family aminotransferase [Nitrospira sp.]
MRFHRTLSPAAAPLTGKDLTNGLRGLLRSERARLELEEDLKSYFGVKYVFCVNSGKTALTLILLALQELSPKKEVVLPAYTCFSVPSAVLRAGLRPRLCDVDERTFDFKFEELQRVVGPETLCVVPCHLFGIPANLDRLQVLCKANSVMLVEDAAQAMGVTQDDRKLGTIGDVGFYSLGRGKMITCGEGGVIVTNSDELAQILDRHHAALPKSPFIEGGIDLLKTCLMLLMIRPSLFWIPASIPLLKLGQTFFDKTFPMTRLSGANVGLMRCWRERLTQSLQGRMANVKEYKQVLCLTELSEKPRAYLRLPVLAVSRSDRDALLDRARRAGVGLSFMYPTTLNEINEVRDEKKQYPGAQSIVDRLVTLPTHQYVSPQDRQVICALVQPHLVPSS